MKKKVEIMTLREYLSEAHGDTNERETRFTNVFAYVRPLIREIEDVTDQEIQKELRDISAPQAPTSLYMAMSQDEIDGLLELSGIVPSLGGAYARINYLVVHKGRRKNGIGAALVEAARAFAQDGLAKYLCVPIIRSAPAEGTHPIEFYKKLGFIRDPSNAYHLELR